MIEEETGVRPGNEKAVISTSLLGRMGDQEKEGAGAGAALARGGSAETGGKSRVDPERGRGKGDQPCNKFPGRGGSGAGGGGSGRRRSPPEPGGAAKADSIAEPLRRRGQP